MITSRELLVAALLWLAALGANLVTATRSPTAWHDEVYFADPAIHFAQGDGFRTTAWTLVGEDVYWPGLVPAYGFALGGWLKVVGVGLWQVRALPILMAAVAAGWVWWTSRWRGHVGSSGAGLVLLALLLCGGGVVFSYRSGRGDALAMLWWAAAYAAAASAGHWRVGLIALFSIGLAAPWCGLFLGPYVAVMGAFLLWIGGRRWLGRVCAAGAGMVVGALCLVGFYKITGGWDAFVACSRMYQNGIFSPHFRFRLDGFRDISLLLVWVGQGIAVFTRDFMPAAAGTTGEIKCRLRLGARGGSMTQRAPRRSLHRDPILESAGASLDRRIARVALISAPVVGVLLAMTGKFPAYYSWLVFFPCAAALAHAIPSFTAPVARRAVIALAVLAAVIGLPARLGVCLVEWGQRDYGRVEAFVAQNFRRGDRVACDPSAYFALWPIADKVYPRATDAVAEMPDSVPATITAACVRPEIDAAALASIFGGAWIRVDSLGDGVDRPRVGRAAPYRLDAYRKVE